MLIPRWIARLTIERGLFILIESETEIVVVDDITFALAFVYLFEQVLHIIKVSLDNASSIMLTFFLWRRKRIRRIEWKRSSFNTAAILI